MSIVQDALKKAQVDYLEKKVPARRKAQVRVPTAQRNALPKIDLYKKIKVSLTILSLFLVSLLVISALGMKIFSLTRPSLPDKDAPALKPLAEIVAPSTFIKPKIEPVAAPIKPALLPEPTFLLNGIMYLDGKPQAIINGYILEEGDSLNDATVMVIDKDYVLLNLKDDKVRLSLKHDQS